MITAFVLIHVADRRVKEASEYLLTLDGVSEVHVIAGEYDIIAVIRVKDNPSLSGLVTNKVVHAPGVDRTKTLFALNSLSDFNLEEIFLGESQGV